ncbi:LCP family protein [Demequina lignilytica]|uniref:LCP family protein n=1 Tax=Demequina lignilytica TaxID=3051663 RepID=A0AB35MES7_9MICO|nr:LCP family protein [Demequina sp. SYSU T0a273]MDN4482251.1 LCP family protein [Demequina sp. SYSU T0a273]
MTTPGDDEPRRMPPSIQPRGAQRPPAPQRPASSSRPAPPPAGAPTRRSTGAFDTSQRGAAPAGRRPADPASSPRRNPPAQAPVAATRVAPPGAYDAPPPGAPPSRTAPPSGAPRRRRHRLRTVVLVVLLLVVGSLVWFAAWASGRIQHVEALSGAPDTPGRTYLIVGSDSRDGWADDGTEGARTDTIMLLHVPESGPTALVSIPRDSYVAIPGYQDNKINAAFAFGGAPLLVETVEGLTGLTVDLYLEVGFTGVADMVDAVGGVELCYDRDVDDKLSRLEWEAGCHEADGATALAFSRMRYSDPLGDIGRTQRQRQVVSAVASEALAPGTFLNPFRMVALTSAGLDAFAVSDGSGVVDLARAAFDIRGGLAGDAVTGTPPIRNMGYSVKGVGSTVLLDPDTSPAFWEGVAEGTFEPGSEIGGLE